MIDSLLYAVAEMSPAPAKWHDVLVNMIYDQGFGSRSGMSFSDIVQLAVDKDLISFNKETDELSFKR
jgi:hypothetical protein